MIANVAPGGRVILWCDTGCDVVVQQCYQAGHAALQYSSDMMLVLLPCTALRLKFDMQVSCPACTRCPWDVAVVNIKACSGGVDATSTESYCVRCPMSLLATPCCGCLVRLCGMVVAYILCQFVLDNLKLVHSNLWSSLLVFVS